MRPKSIVMFERLFLASMAISLVVAVIGYDQIERVAATDPALRQFGLGSGLLIGVIAASYAIYLLLWYLIAHRAVNVAKWVLVVFVAFGVASSVPAILKAQMGYMTMLSLAAYALEIAALVYLFQADAKAWFRGDPSSDPRAFD